MPPPTPSTAQLSMSLAVHFTVPPDWSEAEARNIIEARLRAWVEDPDNELRQAYGLFSSYQQDEPAIAVMSAEITQPEEEPRGTTT